MIKRSNLLLATGAALVLGTGAVTLQHSGEKDSMDASATDKGLVSICKDARGKVSQLLDKSGDKSIADENVSCEAAWKKCNNGADYQACEIGDWKSPAMMIAAKGQQSGGISTSQLQEWAQGCVKKLTSCYQAIDDRHRAK
jgi:hypothetical protein